MARIFIKLYLLLIVALGLFVAVVANIDNLMQDTLENFMNDLTFGSLSLLDQQVNDMDAMQQQAYLDEINALGGYPLELGTAKTFKLDEDTQQRLAKKGYVSVKQYGRPFIYRRMQHSDRILKVPFDQPRIEHEIRLTRSTFALLENELKKYPQQQWPQAIQGIAPVFNFAVVLLKPDQLQLPDEEKAAVLAGDSHWHMIDDATDFDYRRIAGSDYVLRLGPFPEPAVLSHLQLGLIVLLALFLATSALLWVVPVWKDVRTLDAAARRFGMGSFTERAAVKSGSAMFRLADTFNAMANRIQSLISSHKELTNAVSHELRTPIARLRFGMEMLENSSQEQDRERYLQSMNADIDELDNLVAELLTYARFDRDHPAFEFKQVLVKPWIEDLLQRFAFQTEEHRIGCHVSDERLSARFDPRLMARVINNLLSNALRYSRERISVSVTLQSTNLVICVDDDGPGIAAHQREQVFHPFTRLDRSRDRETGGYGLGLAIVNRIVNWHQGSISIDTSPMGGARFCLSFPGGHSDPVAT